MGCAANTPIESFCFLKFNLKNINSYKSYRTKYKRYFDIDFGHNFAIHHIDFNHSNNDINNLLLLPVELHAKYHLIINALSIDPVKTKSDGFIDFRLSNRLVTDYGFNFVDDIADTISECKMWIDLKNNKYDEKLQIMLLGRKVI